jgi:hypothetical protein
MNEFIQQTIDWLSKGQLPVYMGDPIRAEDAAFLIQGAFSMSADANKWDTFMQYLSVKFKEAWIDFIITNKNTWIKWNYATWEIILPSWERCGVVVSQWGIRIDRAL